VLLPRFAERANINASSSGSVALDECEGEGVADG